MKLLSIVVPSYNSQDYLEACINSLITQREFVEIIIVNDGSKDKTEIIGAEFVDKYPDCVKLINKINGGHGSAVNTGIENATGIYFKVVDSDDWVDQKAYSKVIETLLKFEVKQIDMLLSNYVYEKQSAKVKTVMQYRKLIPAEQILTWEDIDKFTFGKYILMHSVIYRLDVLKQSGLKLPEHTFYVDNIFVYTPLPFVKSFYYIDVDFYRYFIGRDDQSVNEKNMVKRIDQQVRVNKIMYQSVDLSTIKNVKLRKYMFQYLEIITLITTIFAIKADRIDLIEELWDFMKMNNVKQYEKLSKTPFCRLTRKTNKRTNKATIAIYNIAQKIYGFN
jgi:glycosyltransferase involved in cell wall biosynthesis